MRASPVQRPQLKTEATRQVLIVDGDGPAAEDLKAFLSMEEGIHAAAVSDPAAAWRLLDQEPISVVLTELSVAGGGGFEFIRRLRERRLPVTVIVLTGSGGIDEAVRAVRLGACDFLTKPIDRSRLRLVLRQALEARALQDELCHQRMSNDFHGILSRSPLMHALFELIGQVADTCSTVLIEGETGTGKEKVAHAIHAASADRKGELVAVNCAAVPEHLLESELFGHERGSFTGAATQRRGRFEQADGGTLLLDEVGDIPAPMQVKLLRVLQERRFERVGGASPIDTDVRVIAATNRDLRRMVRKGHFREDLYYRLDVIRIEVPPLRERPEDIPLLAAHFAAQHAPANGPARFPSPEAVERLLEYDWPGNVRELDNAMQRACFTARGEAIGPDDLSFLTNPSRSKGGFDADLRKPLPDLLAEITSQVERGYLVKALRKTRGHVGKAAQLSGYSRRSVTGKLAEYHIDRTEFLDA